MLLFKVEKAPPVMWSIEGFDPDNSPAVELNTIDANHFWNQSITFSSWWRFGFWNCKKGDTASQLAAAPIFDSSSSYLHRQPLMPFTFKCL